MLLKKVAFPLSFEIFVNSEKSKMFSSYNKQWVLLGSSGSYGKSWIRFRNVYWEFSPTMLSCERVLSLTSKYYIG